MINNSNNKKVIFSTNNNSTYCCFAPYTCLLWQHIAGFCPVLLAIDDSTVTNDTNSDRRYKYTLDFCRGLGVNVINLNRIEARADSCITQVARVFGGALNFSDDTYLLTADIDMWPLTRDYFHRGNGDLNIFFSNANNGKSFPICYLGGKSRIWKEILNTSGDINTAIKNELDIHLPIINGRVSAGMKEYMVLDGSESTIQWYFDEIYVANKIKKWSGYPNRCDMMVRQIHGLPEGRIDRSAFKFHWQTPLPIDMHCPRPIFNIDNWAKVKWYLDKLIGDNNDIYKTLEAYRSGFEAML